MSLLRPKAILVAYNCFEATIEQDGKDPRVLVESALDQSLYLLDFTLVHFLLRPHPNGCTVRRAFLLLYYRPFFSTGFRKCTASILINCHASPGPCPRPCRAPSRERPSDRSISTGVCTQREDRGSGIHFHISGVEGTTKEQRWTLTGDVPPFSYYWLRRRLPRFARNDMSDNTQGFGDGIPRECDVVRSIVQGLRGSFRRPVASGVLCTAGRLTSTDTSLATAPRALRDFSLCLGRRGSTISMVSRQ